SQDSEFRHRLVDYSCRQVHSYATSRAGRRSRESRIWKELNPQASPKNLSSPFKDHHHHHHHHINPLHPERTACFIEPKPQPTSSIDEYPATLPPQTPEQPPKMFRTAL